MTEPDLSAPIAEGFKSTWGDKKRFCKMEAQAAVEDGFGPEINPYIVDSWPWRWWNQFYECRGCGTGRRSNGELD